ncbi:hypothetical protein Vretifemale_6859 [Volvox reticuliferus]|uniref:Uncharacterized protein n=1 Tax=Volvox reticuliferus TaxID=1737510 RepID=A0A8J4CEZ9_9CHLO|nr:hypothetical protein Vretifemale_6859 [Volvox reticuliferus]
MHFTMCLQPLNGSCYTKPSTCFLPRLGSPLVPAAPRASGGRVGDDPARLSGESLPRTAAHQSAVAIVEQQRPGEEHVAAPGLAAGGPAETLVSQAGGSVKAQGEPATSQTLTMSDMRPVSTPFRCFMTGLFSLFQGPRGEYGVESLWWVLDSRNGGESEPLDGKFTEYGLQANTSAASPSAKQQQQQQQQGQQHTVTGPYSSEQMILAYIAQALPHELLVCGTRGCSPPALLPSAESFRPLGLLLDAADAGKPYELLQL